MIITGRTLIGPLTVGDADFIFELVNTSEWKKFIGERNVTSSQSAIDYITRILSNEDVNYHVVRLAEGEVPIGVVTFIKRDYLSYHDIGFAFLPRYFNKGYAFESVQAVLHNILDSYRHPAILATTVVGNTDSVKLLKKLGFSHDKEIVPDKEPLDLYEVSTDTLEISKLVVSFFQLFTNKGGRKPDWELLDRLCVPEAKLTSKSGTAHQSYNLNSFIEPRQKILTDGTLTEFEEHETSAETEIKGHIAQRSTKYSKSGILNGKPFQQRGHKYFQFVKTPQGWRIISAIWEDEPAHS